VNLSKATKSATVVDKLVFGRLTPILLLWGSFRGSTEQESTSAVDHHMYLNAVHKHVEEKIFVILKMATIP
jgi:hypothetical protein